MMQHAAIRLFLAALLSAGLSAAAPALWATPLPAPKPLDPQAKLCAEPIARAEREHRIPNQLLAAVAVAESGRWLGNDRAVFAWPWTVTSGPKTWYFADRDEAVAHVRKLRAGGVRNIDVGCMQVNLAYHGRAFATLEQAFDPEANVDYAANFLARLNAAKRSWMLAVGHYHSSTPALQDKYRRKIVRTWAEERRRAAEEHRQAVMKRFAEQRRIQQARQAAWQAARAQRIAAAGN
ncbi:MAG: hypothetical protein RL477_1629 [Pseudomonadota bacterium]|jgi:hypothetical protein